MSIAQNIQVEGIKEITGGIIAPKGYQAAALHIGIRRKKKDLSLIMCEKPATAAGTFTQNTVKASPVHWCKDHIKNKIKGIVVNSGIANSCTGEEGKRNTKKMAKIYAECLGVDKGEVLVASTGLIGAQLPMDKIKTGIKNCFPLLGKTEQSATDAAEGIMTTDTFAKQIAIETEIGGKTVRIGGMAKGSGMIHPNMATMLGYITTDADISQDLLQKALKITVNDSFNMISVDGDTSTNDMVIALANGLAENTPITAENEDYQQFKKALLYVTKYLAKQIVMDGEGVTKFIEMEVKGTSAKMDAKKIAKSIINSNLFKTAMFGNDANWGRIICAAGYSGIMFDQNRASIEFVSKKGSFFTLKHGEPIVFDEDHALEVLKEREIKVILILEEGDETATAWGCDLSYEYVKINGEYRT